jgi:hypothetical protein
VNTSGEESKSGVPPLTSSLPINSELVDLAQHIITECDRLHLQGLMIIGSLAQSFSSLENKDFETLTKTRDTFGRKSGDNAAKSERSIAERRARTNGYVGKRREIVVKHGHVE